ncbi:glutamate--tRNA ligase, partial [Candidatus Bathyarchaeota archaeon]|nr:glutamate--tRNA ligase [Candidatus Bathyarchaeota archaeon]
EPKDGLAYFLLSKDDLKIFQSGKTLRLMGLFNITINDVGDKIEANIHSETYEEAKRIGVPLIHWLPSGTGIVTSVVMPDASFLSGIAEDSCRALKLGDIVQFERFGFVRIDNVTSNKIATYYTHR